MKSKVRNAFVRKKSIIEKLYVQKYRKSPFSLTAELARTAEIWHEMQLTKHKKKVVDIKEATETIITFKGKDYTSEELIGEISDVELTGHPNTEVVDSKETIHPDLDQDLKSESSQRLPVIICTNPHKLISPIGSHCTALSYHSYNTSIKDEPERTENKEQTNFVLEQTKSIRCYPEGIKVCNENERSIKFTLRNCTTDCIYVRFKDLSNKTSIKKFKLTPSTPVKLCAGLSKVYCLNFKLMPGTKVYEGFLNFRIGFISYKKPEELLSVRFICDYNERRSIDVTETVYIPPVYLWQLTYSKYPFGNIKINVNDDYSYHLHIGKQDINFYELLSDESVNSLHVASPNSESVIQRNDDVESESALISSTKLDNQEKPEEIIETIDIVNGVLNEIITISLQPYYLKSTYLYLHPHSVQNIKVYFTKAEHIGSHQYYYNLDFYNPNDDSVVMRKTIKIFSEILPHPIQIHPIMLDMTECPIKYGIYRDYFTIVNTHIFVPVTIKIKLTTKMKKLFCISPMETLVPAQSEVRFEVHLCPRSVSFPRNEEDSVHFTIKIIVIGDKAIYDNAPPIYYELIVPCASEFKRIYGKKYFKDSPGSSLKLLETTSEIAKQVSTKNVPYK
ncbi:unnamed protein product [Colias eurytheme]|nr:unnamed protein product [Colias eurytheme]